MKASPISAKHTTTFSFAQNPLIIPAQIFFLTPLRTADNIYFEINRKFYLHLVGPGEVTSPDG